MILSENCVNKIIEVCILCSDNDNDNIIFIVHQTPALIGQKRVPNFELPMVTAATAIFPIHRRKIKIRIYMSNRHLDANLPPMTIPM